MDIELLKTFVEVSRTRHFGRAADRLFITQAAVSARIKQLETVIGLPLFTRDRNNVQLTSAGRKLLGYAESMINMWNRARQEIVVETEDRLHLAVGAVAGLWDVMLNEWVNSLYSAFPAMILNAEMADTEVLLRRTREGTLDLALSYECPQVRGVRAAQVATIQLIMVSTSKDISSAQATASNYVYVDWGISFSVAHAEAFPELPTPVLRVDTAGLARAFILARGGSAYLPSIMVSADIAAGRLSVISEAPPIARAVYAHSASDSPRREVIEAAVSRLGEIAQAPPLAGVRAAVNS